MLSGRVYEVKDWNMLQEYILSRSQTLNFLDEPFARKKIRWRSTLVLNSNSREQKLSKNRVKMMTLNVNKQLLSRIEYLEKQQRYDKLRWQDQQKYQRQQRFPGTQRFQGSQRVPGPQEIQPKEDNKKEDKKQTENLRGQLKTMTNKAPIQVNK